MLSFRCECVFSAECDQPERDAGVKPHPSQTFLTPPNFPVSFPPSHLWHIIQFILTLDQLRSTVHPRLLHPLCNSPRWHLSFSPEWARNERLTTAPTREVMMMMMMMIMVMMMMMMSVLLADANEQISAGSPRIGTGVNISPNTSAPSFFCSRQLIHWSSEEEQQNNSCFKCQTDVKFF